MESTNSHVIDATATLKGSAATTISAQKREHSSNHSRWSAVCVCLLLLLLLLLQQLPAAAAAGQPNRHTIARVRGSSHTSSSRVILDAANAGTRRQDGRAFLSLPEVHPNVSRVDGGAFRREPRDHSDDPAANLDCSALPRVFVGVLSTFKNLQNRQVIRQTWGSNACLVRVAFFVLRPMSDTDLLALQREAVEYGDVIVTSEVEDSYYHTTHSVVSMMRAAAALGPRSVDYVLKTDDDVYFRVPLLLQYLATRPKQGLYSGFPMRPILTPHEDNPARYGKSWISREAWPHAWAPPYAWGPGCVLSIDLVQYIAAGVMHSAMKQIGECEDVEVGIWVAAISRLHHVDITYDVSPRIDMHFCDKASLLVHIPRGAGWAQEVHCIHSKSGACCGGKRFVWATQQQQPWQQARLPMAAVAALRRHRR